MVLTTSNNKKQRLLIKDILSSHEIYKRVHSILKPSYFDPEYEKVVAFIHSYFEKYNATPALDVIDAEFDIELETLTTITKDRIASSCDEIERFCKEVAVKNAVYQSMGDIEKQNLSALLDRVTKAVQISLERDMGVDIFENPEDRLRGLVDQYTAIPTGIEGIDSPLGGGLIRRSLTLFSANSGVGKSVMLQNLGHNYSAQGYNVLYITFELPAEMVFLRLGSILSGVDAKVWQSRISQISEGILRAKEKADGGTYLVKRLPIHTTPADIRSFLAFYEMEYHRMPDVLLLDHLDHMDPNSGVNGIGVFEQDKRKTEEVGQIIYDYDMIGITASQQNRGAISMPTPDQSVIAGGISKINTVDNHISLYMTDAMRLEGTMNAHFLKTRSSAGVGHTSLLHFNDKNLRITDSRNGGKPNIMPTTRKKPKVEPSTPEEYKPMDDVTAMVKGIPGIEEEVIVKPLPEGLLFEEQEILTTAKTTPIQADSVISFGENVVTKESVDLLVDWFHGEV